MSVLLGLLIATIGQDPVGGINCHNFGFIDLAAGIAFVPAILGFSPYPVPRPVERRPPASMALPHSS